MIYKIAVSFFRFFFTLIFKIEVKGEEAFPKERPFLLASNHVSNLDPIILGIVCPRRLNFLAKEELFSNRLFAALLKTVGVVPLKRGEVDFYVVRKALRILKEKPLVIFPQGRRGIGYERFKTGVGFFAQRTRVPVIAAKIYGTDQILPKGAKLLRRGTVKVFFERVRNIKSDDSYEATASKVMETIKSL